jgi:hypothetical protein
MPDKPLDLSIMTDLLFRDLDHLSPSAFKLTVLF